MRKLIEIAACLLILLALNHQATAGPVLYDTIPASINQILQLPEKKIDIGLAALTFAKDMYPELDIKAYSTKIDKMAKEAKAFTGKSNDPEYKKLALNTYLFRDYKLEYDLADPYAMKLENRSIKGILDSKKGSCITMPMLYMAIAQRMGYPVYPVATPDHNFLRYVDPKLKKQNIEATSNGGYSPDKVLIKELEVSEKGIKSGAYMKTLTYREYLAEFLSHNGSYWAQQGNFEKALDYLEKATEIYPNGANTFELLARVHYQASKRSDPDTAELHMIDAKDNLEKAISLGFVKISREGHEKYDEHVQKKLQAKNKKRKRA